MRTRLDHLIDERQMIGSSVCAFTCYDFTTAVGVVRAAEALQRGVTLLVTPKTAASDVGIPLIRALRRLADDADVFVSVQLDHATDFDLILAAVAAGVDSVLADGSKLPFEKNAEFVARVRERTSATDTVIEAELGALAGDEDQALAVSPSALTDPDLVAPFIAASGAHILATAVGNVHGTYAAEPALAWNLIETIRRTTVVPLSLHGASGISDADLRRAVGMGIGKVNINTELRSAMLSAGALQIDESRQDGDDVLTFERIWRESATQTAYSAMLRADARATTAGEFHFQHTVPS